MTAEPTPAFDRRRLAAALRWLAERGIYIGTSSWKYEGWLGQIYSAERYLTRGKFSQAKFDRECLREHAEVFSTVCVDAGYYRFPSPQWIQGMMEATPAHYQFTFKVTDDITARTFPNLPRHGDKAGKRNEHFLNAELFQLGFLTPLAPWKEKTGVLIFEFSQFHARDFERGRDFLDALNAFLGALPKGWRYGVEIRNQNFLQPDYFAMLREHGVAHVFNAWTRMPTVSEQIAREGSLGCAEFCTARLLLKQGRTYEDAVQSFQPYTVLREPNEEVRSAAVKIVEYILKQQKSDVTRPKAFVYVNNRLEGNALLTIAAILAELDLPIPFPLPQPESSEPPPFALQ
jgi:uncharacterized protein YecE (DUF72 family)